MGDDPVLWRDVRVKIPGRSSLFLADIINSNKLKLLRDLRLEQCVSAKKAESVLRLVIEHGHIESFDISGNKLSLVDTRTLAKLTRRLKKLRVENCRLTQPQVDTILRTIGEDEAPRLEILLIGNNDLSGLKYDQLGRAACKLSSLHCDNSRLSRALLTNLLTAIRDQAGLSHLQDLNLMQNSLLGIHHSLIAAALTNIKSLNLWGTNAICLSLLTEIGAGRSRIEKLNLGSSDFSYYPPPLVANAVILLREVNLSHVRMCPLALNMLLTTISTSQDCRLESLTMLNIAWSSESVQQLVQKVKDKIPKFEFSFVV